MLQELADESENQCMKMNKAMIKGIKENDTPMYVKYIQIKKAKCYFYLVQKYNTRDINQEKVTQKRTTEGWTAFAKHRHIHPRNIGTRLKRQIYNACVLPAMTYGNMGTHHTSKDMGKINNKGHICDCTSYIIINTNLLVYI